MRRRVTIGALVLATPVLAFAHVSVRPRESKPNVEERYTVRVPTEGSVATTQVLLEIPAGVTVLEVLPHEGATFETARQDDRITAITWKKDIPPKGSAEFVFRARNPASGDIVWKAHQHFSDGTTADWVGVAGEKRPASVTKLAAASAGVPQTADTDAAGIETWLKGYDTAFNAKDHLLQVVGGAIWLGSRGGLAAASGVALVYSLHLLHTYPDVVVGHDCRSSTTSCAAAAVR